jgi:hypothetical protein
MNSPLPNSQEVRSYLSDALAFDETEGEDRNYIKQACGTMKGLDALAASFKQKIV